jgi:general secretion pathway protein E
VLSTLHTNSAVGAVTRLRDMGVEPFLLSSSLIGVLAQRLVRVLDPDTRETYAATPRELAAFGKPADLQANLFKPSSQAAGRHAGYRGRTGIYEYAYVDEEMRRLIHASAAESDLERHARTRTPSILEDGWRKCVAGITSAEEVLRVTREE